MKVLVVEDEALEQKAMIHLLKSRFDGEMNVLVAEDGERAVEIARQRMPDLILMDINLPLLDGITAAGKIREYLPECKIIMISAYSDYQHMRDSIRNQALDYIVKPYSVETFHEAIERAFRKKNDGIELYGKSGTIQRIKNYIEANYTENITLQDVADEVCMDKSYLGRLFRETCEITIMGYQRKLRMNKAKELLSCGMSPGEVAIKTGFGDQAYFGKVFKQETGMSPAKYRNKQ